MVCIALRTPGIAMPSEAERWVAKQMASAAAWIRADRFFMAAVLASGVSFLSVAPAMRLVHGVTARG